jgi:hypothetical protein
MPTEKIDSIQDRYDALCDRLDADPNTYICRCPEHERTLYFVHDVHGVTINRGLSGWVNFRGQGTDQDDVLEAIAAFRRLGFDMAAEAISRLLYHFRQNGGRIPDGVDDSAYSASIWDHTESIYSRLWDYLQTNAPKA